MKRLAEKLIGIFLAVVGIVGVVVELLTTPGWLGKGSLLFLSALLVLLGLFLIGVSTWKSHRISRALPPIKQVEDICTSYQVSAATRDEVDWIAHQEEEVYLFGDAVPKHVLLEWYDSNPTGFSVIKMPNGQKIGHIDLLPIRPNTLRAFIDGNIVEKDIRGDSLFSPGDRNEIRSLYVESIAVQPPKRLSKAPAVICVLTNFLVLVERIADLASVEDVYAIAASSSGETLLKGLGFDALKSGDNRADRHNLYHVMFKDLAQRIGVICGKRFPEESLERIVPQSKNS